MVSPVRRPALRVVPQAPAAVRAGLPLTPRRAAPPGRRTAPAAATDELALARVRRQIEYIDISDITPYPYNPRDNEKAIPAVAESIKSFGFLVPCVVDADNVLVAGHTRTEAAKLLGLTEVPCLRASDLTQDQINAFRLIDNKVAEQAAWDFDLLAGEVGKLGDLGLDLTKFGWTAEEIDCLSEVVASDCLTAPIEVSQEQQESTANRRAPVTARFVLGEIVFFMPANEYRIWVDGLRQLHNFNETAMHEDIKQRLGMLA